MELVLAGNGMDPAVVLGWMLFPNDKELQALYVARNCIANDIDGAEPGGNIQVPASLMERVLAGPGRKQFGEIAAEATQRGTVAGDLLALMCEQNHLGLPASKEKAVRQYKEFALGKRYGDGASLKISRATLLSYFDEFKPVAHLWACHRLNQFSSNPFDPFRSPRGLQEMLGIAKTIGEFAATFVPAHVKPPVPLIPKHLQLQMPDDIEAQEIPWHLGPEPVPV